MHDYFRYKFSEKFLDKYHKRQVLSASANIFQSLTIINIKIYYMNIMNMIFVPWKQNRIREYGEILPHCQGQAET